MSVTSVRVLNSPPHRSTRPGREALTLRQTAIVEQLARGLDTRQTADKLGIAVNTVRVQLNFVYHTLKIRHRGELMLWAIDNGFGARGGR